MKKLLAGLIALVLILTLCVSTTLAYDRSCSYADTDNNGICDNRTTHHSMNYTDTNNDGICDNRAENCIPRTDCPRYTGGHHSYGLGHGCNR